MTGIFKKANNIYFNNKKEELFLNLALDGGDWPQSLSVESKREGSRSSTKVDEKSD
jgi:hypothetical protein